MDKDTALLGIVRDLEAKVQCNCDLDKWEPEKTTGHSWVCQIHKIAMEKWGRPATNQDKIRRE